MRSSLLFALLITPLFASAVVASSTADAEIARATDKLLEQVVVEDGPGAAMLVARGNKVIYRKARGRAEIEFDVPLSPDHVFQIASVTKMFTAAMILKLADSQRLSLDDFLALYLSDFPNAERITLRQLLNHTAGISDIVKEPQPGFSRRDVDTAMLIAEIRKRPLNFEPGTRWSYSNAGFILLGAVIEKITGSPWHDAIDKQLLEPLGLKHTRYGADPTLIKGRVAGYTSDGKAHTVSNAGFISLTVPAAAGALLSTVDDLRQWMRALAAGQVIDKKSFQRMITPVPELAGTQPNYRYGLGTFLWRVRGEAMIGHTGQINGFASALVYLPESDITVIVLANDDNFDARSTARRLAAIALGQPYPEVIAVQPADEELRALVGSYRVDEKTVRTLSLIDGKLHAQRGSGNVLPLQMTASGQLHFIPDELSYFVAVRDVAGKVMRLDYFQDGEGPPKPLPRIESDSH